MARERKYGSEIVNEMAKSFKEYLRMIYPTALERTPLKTGATKPGYIVKVSYRVLGGKSLKISSNILESSKMAKSTDQGCAFTLILEISM